MELKAYGIRGIDGLVVESESGQLYLKSEADKVISELKAQKAQAEDDSAYWKMCEGNAVNAMHETEEYAMQMYRSDRHQKYKRCLAMARFCQYRSEMFFTWSKKKGFLLKWQNRWLELADKFKEAK